METALGIVTEEGFAALTMQRLASDLGYAVGALYRYFPSKDDLVVAVQRRVVEEVHVDVRRALELADSRLGRARSVGEREASLVRLLVALRLYESLATRRPAAFRLLTLSIADPRELVSTEAGARILPSVAALFREVSSLVERAQEVGALGPGDPDRRTVALWAALQGAMQLRKLGRFGVAGLEPGALSAEVLGGLLGGWGASEEAWRDADRRSLVVVGEVVRWAS